MINAVSGDAEFLKGLGFAAGKPAPLGAHVEGDVVNFALFSAHASGVLLCLFSEKTGQEIARIPLREHTGDIWHIAISGLKAGALYGYRVRGEYAPEQGHRFNPNKLLIDPYAKKLSGGLNWCDEIMGYQVGAPDDDLSFDPRDSAFAVPKSVVVGALPADADEARPNITDSERIIYEAHVKGLTQEMAGVGHDARGKFCGLASDSAINHMLKLGINTVELLPVQSFITDRFLIERGLTNYWGYQTIGFFAPDNRYLVSNDPAEFRAMVSRLHAAGIEVILDVVYNHTGEGNRLGPTLSFRGIDNASYYKLEVEPRYYTNYTGTGNMLDLTNFHVLRMVMDSLRYWVEVMGVDGFRFDLATILAREAHGFDREGGFLDCLRQDPVLAKVKLIAEPWDLGPDGYQLGGWPHPFLEWNDRYRDDVRMFWRGDAGKTPALAACLLGSAHFFDHHNRGAFSSVNFVSAHDGFTLADTVRYVQKHNAANLEDNQDGHGANYSDNFGVEGETDDAKINALREKRMRNLLATLLLSQGTPMILAGDEIGNSQGGNNNAYAQDNPTGWINWEKGDPAFFEFVAKMIALRKSSGLLRQTRFLHSNIRAHDGMADLIWRKPDGSEPSPQDWENHAWKALCLELRLAASDPKSEASEEVLFLVFNAGEAVEIAFPKLQNGASWKQLVDTDAPEAAVIEMQAESYLCAAHSVQVFSN